MSLMRKLGIAVVVGAVSLVGCTSAHSSRNLAICYEGNVELIFESESKKEYHCIDAKTIAVDVDGDGSDDYLIHTIFDGNECRVYKQSILKRKE